MGAQRDNYEDTWAGLEPVQPRGDDDRWLTWVGVAVAVLVLSCLCIGGGYIAWRELAGADDALPTLAAPTAPVAIATATSGGATLPAPTPAVVSSPASTAAATLVVPPTVTLPGGQPTLAPTPGSANVAVNQLTIAPTINGDLAEWAGQPTYPSAFRVFSAASWDGSADLSATWRLGWDSNNLYIAVEVVDNLHVQTQSGNQIFRGDSLDMQFDTDRSDLGPGLTTDNFQIIFSPGDFASLPPSAFRFRGNDEGQIPDYPGHSIDVAAQDTAAGYNLEAAIPWSDIHTTPVPGLVLGLALNANDNDRPGEAIQEVMMSHVSTRTFTDPSTWGTLTLR
jgi:hypothetical protein